MCGRFVQTFPADAVRALFRTVNPVVNHPASWNVAPTDPAMAVRRHPETGERHLDVLRWGLVPSFHRGELKAARRPINARSETVASSGLFRAALAERRCLIPADAFYEWVARPDGKQPYLIARADGAPLALAAVWEGWRAPDGSALRSFAILTTAADGTMRSLHERMPVVLEPDDWPAWLGETAGEVAPLMRAAGGHILRFWPVSRAVNSVRRNGPELLDRIDEPSVKPLVGAVGFEPTAR